MPASSGPATTAGIPKKSGIRTGLSVQTGSGNPLSEDERAELDAALGLNSDVVHEYDEANGICSCGLKHTPAEARYRVQEALNKLRETNPKLADSIIPVPINMADGPLNEALKQSKEVIKRALAEWETDKQMRIPLEIFAVCAEKCSEAWIQDLHNTPGFNYPADFEEQMKLETNGLDTINSVLTAMFLSHTPCEACSPALRTVLGVLAVRMRSNEFLSKSAGLVPGSPGGGTEGN